VFVRFHAVHLGSGRYPLEGEPVTHVLLHEVPAVRETLLAQTCPRHAGDLGAVKDVTGERRAVPGGQGVWPRLSRNLARDAAQSERSPAGFPHWTQRPCSRLRRGQRGCRETGAGGTGLPGGFAGGSLHPERAAVTSDAAAAARSRESPGTRNGGRRAG
jgi:hypothetical protein